MSRQTFSARSSDYAKKLGIAALRGPVLNPPVQARSPLMSEDRRKCIEALAGELEDRDVLLERLSQPSDRVEWLRGTKRAVLAQIANGVVMSERVDADLLISTLSQMSASERARTFKDWLERSMPQIEANFTNEFAVDWYQYWTLIGVSDPDGFRRQFGDEIEVAFHSTTACARKGNLPVIVGMYVPGRAVCYVELSGIPLTALKSLETWHVSYLQWSNRGADLHTHFDATQFVHPAIPSDQALETLADDFKYYLLAVMLQVLTPTLQRSMPPGQFQLSVRTGETLNMGNERSFRKYGLPPSRREMIINRVNERIDALGTTQLAALAVLTSYYESIVYAPKKVVIDEAGSEEFRKGFAGNIAGETARELTDRTLRKGMSESELKHLKDTAFERLSMWAAPIEGSESDAYRWEVGNADAETGLRLKYVVRKEFFQEDADDALAEVLGLWSSPTQQSIQYFLALNGQQAEPYTQAKVMQFLTSGQINHLTMTWRQGMAAWLPLSRFPEFAVPPPLPGGAPSLPNATSQTLGGTSNG